jgi:hypothetical protein
MLTIDCEPGNAGKGGATGLPPQAVGNCISVTPDKHIRHSDGCDFDGPYRPTGQKPQVFDPSGRAFLPDRSAVTTISSCVSGIPPAFWAVRTIKLKLLYISSIGKIVNQNSTQKTTSRIFIENWTTQKLSTNGFVSFFW